MLEDQKALEDAEFARETGASIDVAEWERLKQYAGLGEADVEHARSILALIESDIDVIVEHFYEHLTSTPQTAAILSDARLRQRLRASQVTYLRSLLGGESGGAYFENRLHVGKVHERIGLDLRWYLGAYSVYTREIELRVREHPRASLLMSTLSKLMFLDSQLISESYIGKTLHSLKTQRDRLAETVIEQTEQLSSWERLAAVGSMSAKVAHEIRNPISPLSLNAELLADEIQNFAGEDTTEALELLNSIAGELARLNRLVQDYLQFARMPKLDFGTIDLVKLVQSVERLVHEEFTQAKIDIDLSFSEHPEVELMIDGDRNQMRQALLNLLRNAREAMPGGGTIRIEVDVTEDGEFLLAVEDSGSGFGSHDIDSLFDPFFTTKDTGTGLGLPFVQQVAREHSGSVSALPGRESGARFELRLPRSAR